MKPIFAIIFIFISTLTFSQECECKTDSMLKKNISCDKILLDNGASIYWSFNCDSSWLSFENKKNEKKTLYTLKDELEILTGRLGYTEITEFNTVFIVENRVISGCCEPCDYYVHDKNTGELIKYVGRTIFIGENKNTPFIVTVTNSLYDEKIKTDYNSLTIFNLDTKKEFKIKLPKGKIEKGMENNEFRYPEYVFETPEIKDNKLIINYFTERYIKGKEVKLYTITIDLKKYCG